MKEFNEYVLGGIARRITPDKKRADSLVHDSEKRETFLSQIIKSLEMTEDNANYIIEQVYDILIELIRAKMLIAGYSSSGNYAHEAEVSYLNELNFKEYEIITMDELRQFRNGIKYYGRIYTKEEAEKSITFLKSTLPKLKRLIENAN